MKASKAIKNLFFLFVFTICTVYNVLAQNVVDSDLSNKAETNSGNSHTGMYIFICMFLVLSVVVAYTNKTKNT